MRIVVLLVAAFAASAGGCSSMISGCGKRLSELDTKEKVHAAFGKPERVGVEEGEEFEEYHTRRKLRSNRDEAEFMCAALTLGATEVVALPLELGLLVAETVFGQTIRFTYLPTGKVKDAYVGIRPAVPPASEPVERAQQGVPAPAVIPLPAAVPAVPLTAERTVPGR